MYILNRGYLRNHLPSEKSEKILLHQADYVSRGLFNNFLTLSLMVRVTMLTFSWSSSLIEDQTLSSVRGHIDRDSVFVMNL